MCTAVWRMDQGGKLDRKQGQVADAICKEEWQWTGEGWTGPRGLWEVQLTGFGMQEWTRGMVRTI